MILWVRNVNHKKERIGSAFIFQFFGFSFCSISFGGPSKCFKGSAFALPCTDNVGSIRVASSKTVRALSYLSDRREHCLCCTWSLHQLIAQN
jgi:hypothetical protein